MRKMRCRNVSSI